MKRLLKLFGIGREKAILIRDNGDMRVYTVKSRNGIKYVEGTYYHEICTLEPDGTVKGHYSFKHWKPF